MVFLCSYPAFAAFAEAWVLDFAGFGLADCNPKVAVASLQNGVASGTGESCFGGKNLGEIRVKSGTDGEIQGEIFGFFF